MGTLAALNKSEVRLFKVCDELPDFAGQGKQFFNSSLRQGRDSIAFNCCASPWLGMMRKVVSRALMASCLRPCYARIVARA